MKSDLVNRLDTLFEDYNPNINLIREINEILLKMTSSEQLKLHGSVEPTTLKGLYKYIDEINVEHDVKEHIVWFYYVRLHQRKNALIEDCLLDEILNDYMKFQFGALESFVIDLIRQNQISLKQIQRAREVMKNKEIDKQFHIYKIKKDVDNGLLLDRSDLIKLLDLNAFQAIEYVLEKNSIKKEALCEFKIPEKGEKDRKIKEALYKKAQEIGKGDKIVRIEFSKALSHIQDIENDNINVFVELDDGYTYNLVVSTPKNLLWYMDKEGIDFIPASPPDIIVRSLTEENIRKALDTYIQDSAYWLKYYHLAGSKTEAFNIQTLNKALEEQRKHDNDIFLKEDSIENSFKPKLIGFLNNKPLYRSLDTGETFTPEFKMPSEEERRSIEVEQLFYLSVIWSDDIPLTHQIVMIKRIWPGINISNQEVLKLARGKKEWTFANNVSHYQASIAYHKAKEMGLKLEISPM